MTDRSTDNPRIGISQCLLGDTVRYDGGHKRNAFLTDVLAPFVDWVPVCPEVEAGLGTPREAMHLSGNPDSLQLVTIDTNVNLTATLATFSQRRVKELRECDLDGYILKKNSPSCGIHRVKIFTNAGQPSYQGTGIFAAKVQQTFPFLPIEEEDRFRDTLTRENFIERIFCYRKWKNLIQHPRTNRGAIIDFHTRHKYVLLTHSRTHYDTLGKLVATAGQYKPSHLATLYGKTFMESLKIKATIKKHVNVLQQLARQLKNYLSAVEWSELQESIHGYHHQVTPLAIPLTLIKHYVHTLEIHDLADQAYLNPQPRELLLRNYV